METIKWQGLETVLKNLNKEVRKIRKRTQSGITKAALYIRGESQKLCPVVTGNLRNSAFVIGGDGTLFATNVAMTGAKSGNKEMMQAVSEVKAATNLNYKEAIVGFSASYAAYVHENPRAGKTGGFSPSGREYKPPIGSKRKVFSTVGQYKFLEQPLVQDQKRILQIIKDSK